MRIVLVSPSFPTDPESFVPFPATWELACGLISSGHDVLIVTPGEPVEKGGGCLDDVVEGMRVLRASYMAPVYRGSPDYVLDLFLAQLTATYRESIKAIRSFKPDVIEIPDFNGLGLCFAANREFPLVVRSYGPLYRLMPLQTEIDYEQSTIDLITKMETVALAEAEARITICDDLKNSLSMQSKLPVESFQTVRVPYSVPDLSAIDASGNFSSSFPKLAYWGRIGPLKGIETLIHSLPVVAERFPDFQLKLIGNNDINPRTDSPYADEWRDYLSERGLIDNVEFLGFQPRPEIMRISRESDLCIFPSRSETACYAAIEATSYGNCVVASAVGGLREYVRHGETGWLVRPDDPDELACAVIRLAEDEELRARLAREGRRHVRELCDVGRIVRDTIDIYKSAIELFVRKEPTGKNPASELLIELKSREKLTGKATSQPDKAGGSGRSLPVGEKNTVGISRQNVASCLNKVRQSLRRCINSIYESITGKTGDSRHGG